MLINLKSDSQLTLTVANHFLSPILAHSVCVCVCVCARARVCVCASKHEI